MMRCLGMAPEPRFFASEVVRRTREAWLASGRSRDSALNGIPVEETKTMTRESKADPCRPASGSRSRWLSVLVASIVVVAVLAGELWAARETPALHSTAAQQIVADVGTTLARVAAASLVIGPAD